MNTFRSKDTDFTNHKRGEPTLFLIPLVVAFALSPAIKAQTSSPPGIPTAKTTPPRLFTHASPTAIPRFRAQPAGELFLRHPSGSSSPAATDASAGIVLSRVSPAKSLPGDMITISGVGFWSWSPINVFFTTATGNQDLAVYADDAAASDTLINLRVPLGAQTGKIAAEPAWPSGGWPPRVTSSFDFVVLLPLTLGSLDNYIGTRGSAVSVQGSGFMNDPEFFVYFTGASGQQDQPGLISRRSNYGFACTVPPGAISGKIKIVSGTGAEAVEKVSLFDYIVVVPLELTGPSPSSGAHGATVRITGTSFRWNLPETVMFWNGTTTDAAALVVGRGDDYLDVLVPDAAQGTGTIRVTCLGNGYVLIRDTPVAFSVTPEGEEETHH